MYIEFSSKKLKSICEDINKATKVFGKEIAIKLIQRLNELCAADSLRDLNYLPPTRCHPLKGNRKGQYALDLKHPYRLIIVPINCKDTNHTLDLKDIKRIRVVEVVNYHE